MVGRGLACERSNRQTSPELAAWLAILPSQACQPKIPAPETAPNPVDADAAAEAAADAAAGAPAADDDDDRRIWL